MEEDMPRMVKTPWSQDEIPFEQAAEIGTKKVITEHSSVGIVVTTDGTITEILRDDYLTAEERVVNELKELNKPFVIILNSRTPDSQECQNLAKELSKKYETQVIPMSCENMNLEDLNNIFVKLLYEFSVDRINIDLPKWVNGLPLENELKYSLFMSVKNIFKDVNKIIDVRLKIMIILKI